VFLCFQFCENLPPQKQGKVNVPNLNDKVKILLSLKGSMSLADLCGIMGKKNQASVVQHWTLPPGHLWVFLNGSLLGGIYLSTPVAFDSWQCFISLLS
jgi:hypothetical protein